MVSYGCVTSRTEIFSAFTAYFKVRKQWHDIPYTKQRSQWSSPIAPRVSWWGSMTANVTTYMFKEKTSTPEIAMYTHTLTHKHEQTPSKLHRNEHVPAQWACGMNCLLSLSGLPGSIVPRSRGVQTDAQISSRTLPKSQCPITPFLLLPYLTRFSARSAQE